MSRWPTVRIGEVAEVFDGPHATPEKVDLGPVFLGISSLDNGRLDISVSERISEADFAQWTRRVLPAPNDVVFSYETRLGQAALIPEGLRCCLGRRMGLVRPFSEKLDARFFLYQYLSPNYQAFLRSRTIHGSTVDRIPLKDFPNFPIVLPEIAEQRAIAKILGTFDDKIELNRRTNETLEAMARAIFKSWFVDFEPVRAKASGEPPESICRRLGLSPDVLALFSDGFEESLFGDIPLGWSMATLSDFSELNAKSWSAKTLPAQINYVDLANTKNGVIQDVQTFRKSEAPSRARRILRSGDTIIGTVRPGNKSFALVGPRDVQLTGSTGFAVLSPIEDYLTEIVYMAATAEENIERLARLADGGAYPAVSPEIVVATECVQPSVEVAKAFHHVVAPLMKMYDANTIEIDTLAGLRDSLLPELLSGDLTSVELSGESE